MILQKTRKGARLAAIPPDCPAVPLASYDGVVIDA